MKRLNLLTVLFFIGLTAQAQTVDEIINKYHEVTGGKDKWLALQSVRMTGKAKAQGMDFPVSVLQKAPNKQILKVNIQGKEFVQTAYDGTTGWSTNFMSQKPEKMAAEDSDILKQESELQDSFLNYKEKGYTAELQGKETIEGTECYKIKLTKKPVKVDGKEEENFGYYFISVADNVPIMQRSFPKKGQVKGMAIDTYMSDYQEVNGLFMPFTITQKVNGQTAFSMTADKIETNIAVDDKEFAFPNEG
ncbi:hypothetical protein GCM10023187_11780 [Nibrella viscosa]|uniref:Outer membrane lipoprotein-sorting protein n=1 Tax=Nibrella viscosa TaxID=1084524 RepID=A0ABP8K3I4_9BACT